VVVPLRVRDTKKTTPARCANTEGIRGLATTLSQGGVVTDTESTHALYRFYSDTGQLLYIGITNNPGHRFSQHQTSKPWWHEVAGISVERYNTRAAALAAERRAISVERPKYNKQRPSIRRQPVDRRPVGRRLVWVCQECRQPISDGDGYIHVDRAAVQQAEAETAEWYKKYDTSLGVNLGQLLELPRSVPWEVHHRHCDPHPEREGDYWFDVARARTHASLLHWTAHLMSKRWLKFTAWDAFITTAAAVDA
jgi:predicted GIY-YIG superfamily endonuclease